MNSSSSAGQSDHVTTYIFGSVSKRKSNPTSLLTVSGSSASAVGDDCIVSSRRSSATSGKRGSTVSSVHGGSTTSHVANTLTVDAAEQANGHSGNTGFPHDCIVSSRRSSATSGKRGSNLSSVHGGSSTSHAANTLAVDAADQANGHSNHEDSGDERSVSPTTVTVAVASMSRFTCPLCKRQLSEPRVLPCLHAYCTVCLRELDSVPAEAAGTAEITLWSAESDVPFPGGRNGKPVEDQSAAGGGGSSAGSGYESEEPARELAWSPMTGRRGGWRRGVTTSGGTPANSGGSTSAARIIVCPTCGLEARIPPGGVLMFPLHHVLQHRMLVASLARDAAGPAGTVLCDLCSTDVQATSRCSDCLLSLCTFCSEAHQRQRRTAAHEVLHLQEARRRGMRTSRHQLCPAHPGQETRFFCETCGQTACRDCCITLHRDHRPPCEPVARVAPAYISAMRDALERARPLAEGVRTALERLNLLEQRIQNKASSVQQEVDNHMEAWMEALEAHHRALTLQVRKARDSKLQAVRVQQMELERRSGDVSAAVRFADELLAEGSEVEVMSTASPLLRRLEWCSTGGAAAAAAAVRAGGSNSSSSSSTEHASVMADGAPVITRISDCLKFLPGEVSGRTAEGLPLFGVVTTQTYSANHCHIDTDALATCRQHRRVEVLLVTRDSDNQPIGHGGADVTVELRARDLTRRPLSVHVVDRGDGTYLLSFLPDAAGNYSMNVFVQNKPIHGSPFLVYVRPLRPHSGIFHCCTFCSSSGSKDVPCGCGAKMPGGYRGCGHGHNGHPGRRHWSCCGSVLESSECGRGTSSSASVYQFPI